MHRYFLYSLRLFFLLNSDTDINGKFGGFNGGKQTPHYVFEPMVKVCFILFAW